MTDKATPAFPTVMIGEIEGGMTLRDYFAAKALQGLLTTEAVGSTEKYAKIAYRLADVMMEARKE